MRKLNIPFKIDKQYENWQFELDALEDRFNGYHSYSYIGKKLNTFLNISTYKTELIFNGDILTGVIIIFNKNTTSEELEILFDKFGFSFKSILHNCNCYLFHRRLYCIYTNPKSIETYLIYCKVRFIQKHLLLLQKN